MRLHPLILIAAIAFLPYLNANCQKSSVWMLLLDAKNTSSFPALSPQALENRFEQNIPLDESDLPVNSIRIQEISRTDSIRIIGSLRWLNAAIIETPLSPEELTQLFPWSRGVIKPAQRRGMASIPTPQPNSNNLSPNKISADYGFAQVQTQQVGLDCLHDQGYTGENVIVSILDSGFRNADILTAFDSVRLQNRLLAVYDFVNQDLGIYDEDNHGMQVYSVMAARRSGLYKGSAWKSTFALGRTETIFSETAAEESNWLLGMEWSDSLGARVIQSSLGYNRFDGGLGYSYADLDGKTALISRTASIAVQKGIAVVVSAGNEGSNSWMFVTVPADADSILAVGSVDNTGDRSGFSSVGPTADGRIKPDVMAMGASTALYNTSGMISNSSGTSFAAPIVAGITACLSQAHPTRTGFEIMEAIRKSGDRAFNPNNQYGYGIPNACKADSLLRISSTSKNLLEQYQIQVFPNPTQGELTILTSESFTDPIRIYDIQGKLWLETHNSQVNVQDWPNGIYWIRIPLAEQKFTLYKFIKN
jgi:serine protease AprX